MGWNPFDWLFGSNEEVEEPRQETKSLETIIEEKGEIRTINGVDYEFRSDRVIQLTGDSEEDKTGLLSDIHGYVGHSDILVNEFKKQGVKMCIVLGDMSKFPRSKIKESNRDLIYRTLKGLVESGLFVGVLPGNWDMKEDYEPAVTDISREYPNFMDMSKKRLFIAKNFNFISNPFGDDSGYSDEGYRGYPHEMESFVTYARSINNFNPKILLTHQPPLCKGRSGIDVTHAGGAQKGGQAVSWGIKEAGFDAAFGAHMHEAGKRGITTHFEPVPQNTPSSSLIHNPGPSCPWITLDGKAYRGMGSIVTIKNRMFEYKSILMGEWDPKLVLQEIGQDLEFGIMGQD